MTTHIFELLPVCMAIVAIVILSVRFSDRRSLRRKFDRTQIALQIVSAFLLIVAQLSWYTAAVINGAIEDTWFANNIWTIFNTLVMACFILNGVALTIHRSRK